MILAKDAGIGEKAAAWGITNAMKMKSKFGMSLKNKKSATTLKKIIAAAKKSMITSNNAQTVIKSALHFRCLCSYSYTYILKKCNAKIIPVHIMCSILSSQEIFQMHFENPP